MHNDEIRSFQGSVKSVNTDFGYSFGPNYHDDDITDSDNDIESESEFDYLFRPNNWNGTDSDTESNDTEIVSVYQEELLNDSEESSYGCSDDESESEDLSVGSNIDIISDKSDNE